MVGVTAILFFGTIVFFATIVVGIATIVVDCIYCS